VKQRTKLGLALVAFILAGALLWGLSSRPHSEHVAPAPVAPTEEKGAKSVRLKLHFVYDGKDHVVSREIPFTRAVARAAIEELLKGSSGPEGERTVLPPGTELRDITILDGIAYVDFSREFRDNHWGGLASEVDTIYSVVNTLGEFPTVRAVQFLLEGSPLKTIGAGAVDLAGPVKPHLITPAFYTELTARLGGPSEKALPWSAWVKGEERIALREGFPDEVFCGDLDGDGADELVLVVERRVSIWDRGARDYLKAWERKFTSSPSVLLAATREAGQVDLIVASEEGIFVFGWTSHGYVELGWHGLSNRPTDIAAGDTNGDGRAEILALFGRERPEDDRFPSGRIVIWEWNGEAYVKRREESFPFRRLLLADVDGDGRAEVLAFGQRGVTVYGWQGAAYVELGSNPAAGGVLAALLSADVNGDGREELVVRDDASPDIYVYSWEDGSFSKLWQEPPAGDTLPGWDLFSGPRAGAYPTLLAGTNAPGHYLLYRVHPEGWQELLLSGRSGEQVLALGDVDGDGTLELIFRRHQLLSNPVQWLYVGRLGSLPWPASSP
jgi:hypothetical protein